MRNTLTIAEQPAFVLNCLNAAGFQAHLVGGAVRNALLDCEVKDFDISTNAHPQQVTDLFEGKGFKVLPTGIEHGTVTVVVDSEPFEITTWRRDVETDGRRAVVAFADRLEDDAMRRDFTMNALYAAADGTIVDPTGQGLQDADDRRVRFIGDPVERIREDALRILRYFRFNGRFSKGIDRSSSDYLACVKHAELIDTLSRERIGQEMLQILALPDCSDILDAMQESGVLLRTLSASFNFDRKQFSFLTKAERQMGLSPCPLRRLALLVTQSPRDGLRLSKAQARDLSTLMFAEHEAPEVIGYRLGERLGASAYALFSALNKAEPEADTMTLIRRGAARKMPVASSDLKEKYEGRALGEALRRAEEAWIDSGFEMPREHLVQNA